MIIRTTRNTKSKREHARETYLVLQEMNGWSPSVVSKVKPEYVNSGFGSSQNTWRTFELRIRLDMILGNYCRQTNKDNWRLEAGQRWVNDSNLHLNRLALAPKQYTMLLTTAATSTTKRKKTRAQNETKRHKRKSSDAINLRKTKE